MGSEFFAAMRPGAYFINTSRAEVVDQEALGRAVAEKGIRAGLDVFAGGTGRRDRRVSPTRYRAGLPGVYGTHHIGASTDQAQEAIAAETVRIIRQVSARRARCPTWSTWRRTTPGDLRPGGAPPGPSGRAGRACWTRSARREINVQEMENIVFEGAEAAVARIHLETAPGPK